MNQENTDNLTTLATKNIADILKYSIKLNTEEKALVIYDTQNGLTNILTDAYRRNLPDAKFVDFDKLNKGEVMGEINKMKPNDLVVMIQTSNFRLDDFRIRLHLFQQKLKVVEHMHLYRNNENVWDVYVNSLAYDSNYLQTTSHSIKSKLDIAKFLKIKSGDVELIVNSELELAKLNIGDYTAMENIGGTFPIGEVFTEAKNLENMNGEIYIYAFADENFNIQIHSPFKIKIENGIIISWDENTPENFIKIIELIREYERPMIRELGFGLNRAITKERYLEDVTAFERIYGMHLSLGEKHSVYKKAGMATNKTKFHVDIFPVIDLVTTGTSTIYENGNYVV